MTTKAKRERKYALASNSCERLRNLLVQAVDALDAALYADDESPRLDAAEKLLDELELWLDEHPLSSLRGNQGLEALAALPNSPSYREDYQRVLTRKAAPPRSYRAHRFDLRVAKEKDPDYSG